MATAVALAPPLLAGEGVGGEVGGRARQPPFPITRKGTAGTLIKELWVRRYSCGVFSSYSWMIYPGDFDGAGLVGGQRGEEPQRLARQID